MTDLIVVPQAAHWQRLKRLVLDSVSSPITRRVYNLGLDEFFAWYGEEPRPGFTKATVSAWRVALEARGLGAVSINVRITAVRKLAVEAADNGLLAPELAAGITRVKGVASKGVRLGNWLSVRQAQTLLNAPDATTIKGLRDRGILAVLLGCGLRRSEVAALTVPHVQQRDGRWCIVDLVGKHEPTSFRDRHLRFSATERHRRPVSLASRIARSRLEDVHSVLRRTSETLKRSILLAAPVVS
jgi:site-specific recombinase XerD